MNVGTNPLFRLASLVLAAALVAAACSSSVDDEAAPATTEATTTAAPSETVDETVDETTSTSTSTQATTTTTEAPGPRIVDHAFGSTEVPADPQRIVALGEEFLLADLLSLDVRPIASSSNSADVFPGIDPALTQGIEVIATTSLNLEYVAGLEPDLLLAYPGILQFVDYEVLSAIAPMVPIGDDDSDWRERLILTGEAVGQDVELAERIDQIDADIAAATTELTGTSLSVLAVFSGPFIRMYTSAENRLMGAAIEAGASLVPTDVAGADGGGRVVITEEQLGLLQGDVLLLLQSDVNGSGESEAAAELSESTLWQALPAVEADRVVTLDRLGYPGAEGLARFVTDLAAGVAALG